MNKHKRIILLTTFSVIGIALLLEIPLNSINLAKPDKEDRVSKEVLDLQESFVNVVSSVKPAVVSVTTETTLKQEIATPEFFFGDPFEEFFGAPNSRPQPQKKYYERKLQGEGSGVIINPKGYVLTNYHVIQGADEVTVVMSGEKDKKYKAEVAGKDSITDLAILKIKSNDSFPSAELGDSDNLKIGEWVIAIGSPFGLEQTVTAGIVSASRQSLNIEGKQYTNMIQTDAAINRGNSGGPLINLRGEVIGINTAIYAPTGVFSGIGFATPINKAKEILEDLIERGHVSRGWLGVEIRDVDATIARQFGMKDVSGVLINKVVEDSPAGRGGLKRGDIIMSIDGLKIKDSAQLQKTIRDTKPGRNISVSIMRDGGQKKLSVKLTEMDASGSAEKKEKDEKTKTDWLGVQVQNIDSELQQFYSIDRKEKGVIIIKIDAGKEGAALGLELGDLVKGINKQNIESVADFERAIKKVDLDEGVVFDIVRAGKPLYVTYSKKN